MSDENATPVAESTETAEPENVESGATELEQQENEAVKDEAEGSAPEATAEDELSDTEQDGAEPGKESKAVQELKRQRKLRQEAERRAEERERENAYLRGKYEREEANQHVPTVQGEPQLDDYEDYDQYIAALTDYRVDRKMQESVHRNSMAQLDKQYQSRYIKTVQANPGNKMKIDSIGLERSHPDVQQAVKESPVGPQILLYLADNPDEFNRLATATVPIVIKEIGKIEQKLESKSPQQKKQPRQVAQAPAPIKPTSGKAGAIRDVNNLDMSEHMRVMNQRDRQRGYL